MKLSSIHFKEILQAVIIFVLFTYSLYLVLQVVNHRDLPEYGVWIGINPETKQIIALKNFTGEPYKFGIAVQTNTFAQTWLLEIHYNPDKSKGPNE